MGGGDLNLKKSWHPHTMKNQEKVWKAEQARTQEERKLHDLRREIEEEKTREELKRIGRESGVLPNNNAGDKKLDWMYKNSTELLNREEYLLGRKIDKSFEILQAEEKEKEQNLVGVKQPINHVEHECVPFSIRAYKNIANSEQVDLHRKVMEDPLMLIKQREMESRRKILENPVKLKELHRILKTDEKLRKVSKKSKKSKSSKQRKKSKKKHKKRTKSSASSSSRSSASNSDSDLDSKLAKKLKSGLLNKDEASSWGLNLTKLLDSKFEKISHELDKATGKNKKRSEINISESADSDTMYSSQRRKNVSRRSRSLSKRRKVNTNYRISKTVSGHTDKSLNKYKQRRFRSSPQENSSLRRRYHRSSSRSTSGSRDHNSNRKSRSVSKNRRNSTRSHTKDENIRKRLAISPSKEYPYINKPNEHSRLEFRNRKRSNRSRSKSNTKSFSRTQNNHLQKSEKQCSSITKSSSKLTDEEKQAKLNEMTSNAAWREEERTEVVRKYRETYAKEEEHHTSAEFDKDFINKEVKKVMANQTSVGSRLRANLNNIQRTSTAMNSNFARK